MKPISTATLKKGASVKATHSGSSHSSANAPKQQSPLSKRAL